MFDWLRKRLVRRSEPDAHASDVDQAHKKQQQQFDEWDRALREVQRVEAVTAGRKLRRTR